MLLIIPNPYPGTLGQREYLKMWNLPNENATIKEWIAWMVFVFSGFPLPYPLM